MGKRIGDIGGWINRNMWHRRMGKRKGGLGGWVKWGSE